LVTPWISRHALGRLGSRRAIAAACPIAVAALLMAATGIATAAPALLALGVATVTVAFGFGQPAMISAVDEAVSAADRGVAIGVATLVFLVGASVGAALVGGLGEVTGLAVVFVVLMALPVAGLTVLLLGGRRPALA
jgi:predicted MFS family arabinose efflux permease